MMLFMLLIMYNVVIILYDEIIFLVIVHVVVDKVMLL